MGILDEAIREHLALKRREGLSDDELRRLEDEAFGPPARPGEPDFPDQEADEPAAEEHETLAESQGGRALEETSGQPTLEGADAGPVDVGDDTGAAAEAEAEAVEEPEGFPDDLAAGPPTEEAEAEIAPDEPERVHGDELDIEELELELDEEVAEGGEPEPGVPPEPEAAPPPASVEALETVEHPIGEELEEVESDEFAFDAEELEEGELEEGEFEEGEPDEQEPAGEEGGERTVEGEDVLEETPDFLRDAPEDDELWFEQREPKDFDF
jgi:hypothetical protein